MALFVCTQRSGMPEDWPPDDISGFYLSAADREKRKSRQSLAAAKKEAGITGKRTTDIVLTPDRPAKTLTTRRTSKSLGGKR